MYLDRDRIRVLALPCLLSIVSTSSLALAQVNEVWAARYNGPGTNGGDEATALVLDGDGNIYVTGHSSRASGESDYVTVKYSREGQELWVAFYDGPNGWSDRPTAIGVDSDGNVCVTGQSSGSGTGWDYATVKYSPEGEELWVARYDGSPSQFDHAAALALDGHGNVYVTGNSGSGHYATVKYSPDGEELWVVRYDGPPGGYSTGIALALDSDGNLYVTGTSRRPDAERSDYATVKYSPEGEKLWAAEYEGPRGGNDVARSLALGDDGSVYVTGSSRGDYATVKYSAEGEELWVVHYDGPALGEDRASALGIDSEGNIYVTGFSQQSRDWLNGDYVTVKYSPDGEELWVARYDGPGGLSDEARALAVDGEGNVYVTGTSQGSGTGGRDYATVKYSADGEELWVARYRGPDGHSNALAVDREGNVHVTGSSRWDYATVKYSPQGEELWVARYNRLLGGGDSASALAVDRDGNVFVAGSSQSPDTGVDCATVKYSPGGEELWVARYGGGGSEQAIAIGLDGDGDACVVVSRGGDYVTVKYGSEGEELWVARYDGPIGGYDYPSALAVDPEGNVHVTGHSEGADTVIDYATVKYSPGGEELWAVRYDDPAGGYTKDKPSALALDSEGSVYVTGTSGTVKYDSEGNERWVVERGGSALAVDSEGNVCVTGWPETAKYDSEGNELWVVERRGWALAIDNDGNVLMISYAGDSDRGYDYATLKYSPDGEELWVVHYDGPAGGDDHASALVLDGVGNVYVTGKSESAGTSWDYATVKYSPGGEELWVVRYDGPAGGDDRPAAIGLDRDGNVHVAGASVGAGTERDYATVKYEQGDFPEILPSDCNADGTVDIIDGVSLSGHLFLGDPPELPCGDGTLQDPGNSRLLDANGDEEVDLSDAIYVFGFLFLAAPAPVLGTECVPIAGCPPACRP